MQRIRKTNTIVYFSHWTRKAYAVFNSLKKVVKISGLSVAITAVALPGAVVAQEDTTQKVSSHYDLDEVEIVDAESLQIFEVPSRVIAVVDRQELESLPIESVQDIFNYVSQIDLRQRGNNDVQSDLSIRGGSFDQVLVMLNGVNITSPQTGHHNLDLPISFDQIERVEVLNGAGSQSYGANAYSGAINIITRNSHKNEVVLKAVAGDFGLVNLGASVNFVGKKLGQFLALNHDASSGYMENTDFARTSLFYNGKYQFRKSFIEWQLSGAQKAFGSQSFYTAKYPNQFETTKSALASIKFQSYGKISTNSNVYWSMHADQFELFRDYESAPSWYNNPNYHLTNVAGGNAKAVYRSRYGKTTMGLDIRYEHIASNVLGKSIGDTIYTVFDKEAFYTKKDARTNAAVSLEQNLKFKGFNIVGALTFNTNSAYSNNFAFYPGIDISYRFQQNWEFSASFNKSMRLPTFTDLYYAGPANIGNTDLLPEEALNLDFGAVFKKGITKIALTSFNSMGSNSIDWVRKSDTQKWQPMNITQVRTNGVDAMLKFDLGKLYNRKFVIQYLSLQYTFINKSATTNDYESRYVMDYLRQKMVLGIHQRVYKEIYAAWNLRYQLRNGDYMLWDNETKTEHSTPYGDYTLVDFKLYWRSKGWTVFAVVKNIFDVDYVDYGNVMQPGRWFSVGVKKRFEFGKSSGKLK